MGFEWVFWGFLGLSIVLTLLRYWFYKFHIQGDNLHIQSGWWNRKHLSLPLKSIQAVHLEQSIWQQILKVAKVSFDSAGSEQIEAKIEALSLSKAEALKKILLQEPDYQENATSSEKQAGEPTRKTYRLTDTDVFKLALSANHIRTFFLLFVFAIKFITDAQEVLDADQREAIGSYTDNAIAALSWVFFVVVFLMIAIVSVIISASRVFLEYYDFRMQETEKGWKVSHGLLTQKQKVISRSKIQMVEYRANWIRRLLDFWFIDLSILGQDKMKKQAQINVPLTSFAEVKHLADEYLPHESIQKTGERISPTYWGRQVLFRVLPTCVVLWGVLRLMSGEWLISSATAGILCLNWVIHVWVWRKKFRWFAKEDGLVVFKSVWGQSYTLLVWHKVQTVRLSQTIYQRQKGLANLQFITAGGEITLPYLSLPTAQRLLDETLYKIESRQDAWL
jgi:putative membrane protein